METRKCTETKKTRHGDWFLTYTGVQFYPMDPRPEDIHIDDIAHALSNICRFGGHSRWFYSVAQHSVLCAYNAPPEHALAALMHDATEAYVGDMVRPLKLNMPAYRQAEDRLWECIARRFNLPVDLDPVVKFIDNRALMTERRDLLILTPHVWSLEASHPPFPSRIIVETPEIARSRFLMRWDALTRRVSALA